VSDQSLRRALFGRFYVVSSVAGQCLSSVLCIIVFLIMSYVSGYE
jgi:hypothetical protein